MRHQTGTGAIVYRFVVSLLILLAGCCAVPAQPVQAKHAKVELLSHQPPAHPGKGLLLGVHFVLEPGWHIYWINPGDSGQPPVFKWQLPAGFSAGEILWPRPNRMQSSPQMADYGYHDDVLLMVPVHASQAQSSNAPMEVGLEAKWLICREVCIADHAQLHLSLPLPAAPVAKENPASAELFARTEKLLPKPLPHGWKANAESKKDSFVLHIFTHAGERLGQAEFFPLDPGQVDNAARQDLQLSAQGVKITLKKSDFLTKPIAVLRGVLVLPGGDAYRIEAPVTKSIQ